MIEFWAPVEGAAGQCWHGFDDEDCAVCGASAAPMHGLMQPDCPDAERACEGCAAIRCSDYVGIVLEVGAVVMPEQRSESERRKEIADLLKASNAHLEAVDEKLAMHDAIAAGSAALDDLEAFEERPLHSLSEEEFDEFRLGLEAIYMEEILYVEKMALEEDEKELFGGGVLVSVRMGDGSDAVGIDGNCTVRDAWDIVGMETRKRAGEHIDYLKAREDGTVCLLNRRLPAGK